MKNFIYILVTCLLAIFLLSWANRKVKKDLPTVLSVVELENVSKVKSGKNTFHLKFSESMDTKFSGFQHGPRGKETAIIVDQFRFLDDKTGVIELLLEPNRFYQLEASTNFRNKEGVRINPYLIEIQTGN